MIVNLTPAEIRVIKSVIKMNIQCEEDSIRTIPQDAPTWRRRLKHWHNIKKKLTLPEPKIYLFWDTLNNEPMILGEDGEFYFYTEDSVAIARNEPGGREWCRLNKMQDVNPLNDRKRHEIFDEKLNDWTTLDRVRVELLKEVHRAAGDPDWDDVI